MLFNRNFTIFHFFIHLPYHSMGISHFSYFLVNFPCYSMGNLHFANFPCYSIGIRRLKAQGGDGRTDVRMYGQTYGNSPLCPTGHRPFGAAAQKGIVAEALHAFHMTSFKYLSRAGLWNRLNMIWMGLLKVGKLSAKKSRSGNFVQPLLLHRWECHHLHAHFFHESYANSFDIPAKAYFAAAKICVWNQNWHNFLCRIHIWAPKWVWMMPDGAKWRKKSE